MRATAASVAGAMQRGVGAQDHQVERQVRQLLALRVAWVAGNVASEVCR